MGANDPTRLNRILDPFGSAGRGGEAWKCEWWAARRRPLHPGAFLESRYMRPLRISQQQLAQDLAISRRRINELVRGHRGVSTDTAIRLGVHFRTGATFWLDLQNAWECHRAWRRFHHGRQA